MHGPARNAYAAYRKNEIEGLTPVEIVCRLFQKLHLELEAAREAIQNKKIAAKGESLSRALAIIGELQASLNLEEGGEIAANLNGIYHFLILEIPMASVNNDAERLAKVIKIVGPLVEAWEQTAMAAKNQGKVIGVRPEAAQQCSIHATF
jgi:flagellar secretion chaperone FliS